MIDWFSIALLLLGVYYAGLMGLFAWGFRRVLQASPVQPRAEAALPFVSVVVAARNEAASIEACLKAILANDYPADRFELIVVDDFSDDATAALVEQHRTSSAVVGSAALPDVPARLRLIRMSDQADVPAGHKGHALACGIAAARGSLLLTTDADCRVRPGWIRAMVWCFGPDTAFVSGPVLYPTGTSLAGDLQALEFLGLIAVGAGAIGAGRPNLCNSANVAYHRDVYNALRPPLDVRALRPNEDEILLQTIARETGWEIAFCPSLEAAVEADPVLDVQGFLAQRRRWAGAGARYPNPAMVASIVGVWLFYALLLAGAVAALWVPSLWPTVLGTFGLKVFSEALLLVPACRHFRRKGLLRYFLPEQLLQIPYVVLIGALGALGSVYWKGRRIS